MKRPATNTATKYELVAKNLETGATILVGYTPRKNVAGIVDMLLTGTERRIDLLSKKTGVTPEAWETPKRGGGVKVVALGWEVVFSGRTQRDVFTLGELADTIYA